MAKKKFKVIEKDAKDAPVKDVHWEGEELQAEATTKIQDDTGMGQAVVIRFFDFSANPETFKVHKPTAQELLNCHLKGMEAILWKDGLKPFTEVLPRLMFSKDKSHYRFVIPCIPMQPQALLTKTNTLSELLVAK